MVQFPFPQLWESEKMAGGNSGGVSGGEKGSAPSTLPPDGASVMGTVGKPKGWLGQHVGLGGQKGRSNSSLQSQWGQLGSSY